MGDMNCYGITSVNDIEIHPDALPWYHASDPVYDVDAAMELLHEWDYDSDPHGYCHMRAMIWGLLREIDRLRRQIAGQDVDLPERLDPLACATAVP